MNSSGLSVKVCLPKEEGQELESYVVIEYLMGLVKLEAQRQFSVNTASFTNQIDTIRTKQTM